VCRPVVVTIEQVCRPSDGHNIEEERRGQEIGFRQQSSMKPCF
jgi:hypothetical protein